MIRFALHCGRDHSFEGWFKDGETFERQAREGDIACPVCGDRSARKAMMAPAVVRSRPRAAAGAPALRQAPEQPSAPEQPPAKVPREAPPDHVKAAMMVAMLRQVRAHVEKNFENVGDRFPDEARRIHHGEAEARDIFGQATLEEARELHEEGIPVRPLPEVPELDG
jgi:hypothetical protein